MTIKYIYQGKQLTLEIGGKRERCYWFHGLCFVRCKDGIYREQGAAKSDDTRARRPLRLMPESDE